MIIAVLRGTVNRKSLAAARTPFFCRAVTKVYGKSARGNTWAYAPCVISSAEGGEGSPFCHPEQSEAKAKDLYENNDDIRIEIPRQARDDGRTRLLFCVTLSGKATKLP